MRSLLAAVTLGLAAPLLAQEAAVPAPEKPASATQAPAAASDAPPAEAKPAKKAAAPKDASADTAAEHASAQDEAKPAEKPSRSRARAKAGAKDDAKDAADVAAAAKDRSETPSAKGAPAEAKEAEAAAAADSKPDVKPMAPRPAEPAKPASEQDQVADLARHFFQSLLAADIHGAVTLSAFPFVLESHTLANARDAGEEWNRQLHSKRTDLLALNGIEVLSPADMEKKYGHPPARLSNLPIHGAHTWCAVANLSGHPAVAIVREEGPERTLKVVGYTD